MGELIQTPGRMARILRRPAELVNGILAPLLGRRIEIANGQTFDVPSNVLNKVTGDCDEGGVLVASGPPCVGIETCLRFGGHIDRETNEPSPHHVWAAAWVDEAVNPRTGDCWWDMDVTIPHFRVGDCAPFEVYAKAFVWREG